MECSKESIEMPAYVVDNTSNVKAITEAVEGLRRMVALGKASEEALQSLEQNHHYNKIVGWATSGTHPAIRFSRFPRYQPISRDDMPNLADLRLDLTTGYRSQYGGHKCDEYPVRLCGEYYIYHKDESLSMEPIGNGDGVVIGKLRVNKNTISWIQNGRYTFPVTEKRKTVEATIARVRASYGAIEAVANTIGEWIIVADSKREESFCLNQKAKDLKRMAPKWLIKDGHVLRMLEDIVRASWIEGVMNQ